jgi:uncharacterized membrane protein YidH (DUF202 family)
MTLGFVVARIGVWLRALAARDQIDAQPFGTAWIGAVFVALGVLANASATWRYARIRRALRAGVEVPDDRTPLVFAAVVTILGALIGAYLVRRLV